MTCFEQVKCYSHPLSTLTSPVATLEKMYENYRRALQDALNYQVSAVRGRTTHTP